MDATVMPELSTSCGTKRDKSMSWTSVMLIWKKKFIRISVVFGQLNWNRPERLNIKEEIIECIKMMKEQCFLVVFWICWAALWQCEKPSSCNSIYDQVNFNTENTHNGSPIIKVLFHHLHISRPADSCVIKLTTRNQNNLRLNITTLWFFPTIQTTWHQPTLRAGTSHIKIKSYEGKRRFCSESRSSGTLWLNATGENVFLFTVFSCSSSFSSSSSSYPVSTASASSSSTNSGRNSKTSRPLTFK